MSDQEDPKLPSNYFGESAKSLSGEMVVIPPRMRSIFDQSSLGIVEVGLDRHVRFANRAALRMLGTPSYLGLNLDHAIGRAEDMRVLDEQITRRRGGSLENYGVMITRMDTKKRVDVDVTGVPLLDPEGNVTGSLGIFRNVTLHTLTSRIEEINRQHAGADELLGAMASELARNFSFERLSITRFSDEGMTHLRAMYVHGDESIATTSKGWWPITEAQRLWMAIRGAVLIPDLPALFTKPPWDSIADDPSVRATLDAGFKSVLRRDVSRQGALLGSIALLSKSASAFDEEDRRLFEAIPVDSTVLQAMDYQDRIATDRLLRLNGALNQCTSLHAACQTLASELGEMFRWPHISIFRADEGAGRLSLVAQHVAEPYGIRLGEGYSQALAEGVLGRVVAERKTRNIPNVNADPDYIHGNKSGMVYSEMCVPIFYKGEDRVRWIINVEDSHPYAFTAYAQQSVEWLAAEISLVLQRISESHLYRQCFESASDPMLAVNSELAITRANRAAATLLGFASGALPAEPRLKLPDLFADNDKLRAREAVGQEAQKRELANMTLHRVGEAAVENASVSTVPVHLSWRPLPESTGTVVVLRNLRNIQRNVENAMLANAAYQVALETSNPLTEAMVMIDELASELPKRKSHLAEIRRNLGRVKDAYTRQAAFNMRGKTLSASPAMIDLDLLAELKALIADLPKSNRKKVSLAGRKRVAPIRGDYYPLRIAFETLLSTLIRCAPRTKKVVVKLAQSGSHVTVTISGQVPQGDADPAKARIGSESSTILGISRPYLDTVVKAHKAELDDSPSSTSGEQVFRLTFPRSDVESAAA